MNTHLSRLTRWRQSWQSCRADSNNVWYLRCLSSAHKRHINERAIDFVYILAIICIEANHLYAKWRKNDPVVQIQRNMKCKLKLQSHSTMPGKY